MDDARDAASSVSSTLSIPSCSIPGIKEKMPQCADIMLCLPLIAVVRRLMFVAISWEAH